LEWLGVHDRCRAPELPKNNGVRHWHVRGVGHDEVVTSPDLPDSSTEQLRAYLREVAAVVATHGHAVQGVGGDTGHPGFAYTVGLAGDGHHELAVSGLGFEVAADILDLAAAQLRAGSDAFTPGGRVSGLLSGDLLMAVRAVGDPYALKVAQVLGGEPGAPVAAWQLLWPGPDGTYPGEDAGGPVLGQSLL